MSDDRTTDMIGSESGSTFWMTGGSTCGGRSRIAPETFSRTSLAASLMSRSSTKRRVTVALPSLMRCASISSMPEMLLSASSSGSTTAVAISAGLAPGSCTLTVTVAGSAWGKRSTPRSRNEKMPITTSDITSIVAKTGRRTLSSERDTLALRGLDRLLACRLAGDARAVGELLDVGRRDRLAGRDPADDLHALAHAIADL